MCAGSGAATIQGTAPGLCPGAQSRFTDGVSRAAVQLLSAAQPWRRRAAEKPRAPAPVSPPPWWVQQAAYMNRRARRDVLGNPVQAKRTSPSRSTVALQPGYHLIDRIAVSRACLRDAQQGAAWVTSPLPWQAAPRIVFSWPQAGERIGCGRDRRLKADHVARQVDDSYRLPMSSSLAALPIRPACSRSWVASESDMK